VADLKHCPFCGAVPTVIEDYIRGSMVFVVCGGCNTRGPMGDDEREAAELWNRRVPTDSETGEPYFRIRRPGLSGHWSGRIVLNTEFEWGRVVPGTVQYGDWLDDGEGAMRDQFGKGEVVATVDYAAGTITPITDRETATRPGSARSGE
jgi:Lar family restriction alleviation protein